MNHPTAATATNNIHTTSINTLSTGLNAQLNTNINIIKKSNHKLSRLINRLYTDNTINNKLYIDTITNEFNQLTQYIKQSINNIKYRSTNELNDPYVDKLIELFHIEYKLYQNNIQRFDKIQHQSIDVEAQQQHTPTHQQQQLLMRSDDDNKLIEYNDHDELQRRHQQIVSLERTMSEVSELFIDMQNIVQQQQESLDHIESNIEHTHQQVITGTDQLHQADVYASQSRKRQCCLVLLLTVLIVTIIMPLMWIVRT